MRSGGKSAGLILIFICGPLVAPFSLDFLLCPQELSLEIALSFQASSAHPKAVELCVQCLRLCMW